MWFPRSGGDADISWVKPSLRQMLWTPCFSLAAFKLETTGKTRKSLSLLKHNSTKEYSVVMICSTARMVFASSEQHSLFSIIEWLCFYPSTVRAGRLRSWTRPSRGEEEGSFPLPGPWPTQRFALISLHLLVPPRQEPVGFTTERMDEQ